MLIDEIFQDAIFNGNDNISQDCRKLADWLKVLQCELAISDATTGNYI